MGISGEFYNLLENYVSGRFQKVVLNGQTSSWRPVLADVPQESIMGPLLFLIYTNVLPNELKSNVKLFADDTKSLFTIVKDKNEKTNIINNDLLQIGKSFLTQILTNRPKKLYFQEKKVQVHPTINFNNITVERTSYQKHLGILRNEKLNYQQHIDSVIPKINKGISVINKRRHSLPRKSLLIKYKAFLKASN